MNAKKCKNARKLARKLSTDYPAYSLVQKSKTNYRQAVNYLKSTRGIYRYIKKLIRKGFTMKKITEANINELA